MLTSLYDLPNWLLGLVISGSAVAFSLGAYFVFLRLSKADFTDEDRSRAMSVLAVVATSIRCCSPSRPSRCGSHSAPRRRRWFTRRTRTMLRQYAQLVVDNEWTDMRTGGANLEAWRSVDNLFRIMGAVDPDTPKRVALLPEMWGRTNELLGHRRNRLYMSQAEVPGTLWAVVLAGTALTLMTTFVLPPMRFNIVMIGGLGFSIGLVFYFIIAMDRPFAGEESISRAPFQTAIDNMQRWDDESR